MMGKKDNMVVIAGPTAVGKSALGIELAKKLNGEIISADSMQIYREMDVGTAKVTAEEMQGIKHHLIDIVEPDVNFNVNDYKKKADEVIEDILSRGKLPIMVGGTGFYIQAVLKDVDFTEEKTDSLLREYFDKKSSTEDGRDELYNRLVIIDKDYADTVHKNNIKRVIRALEYNYLTGEKMSVHNKREEKREYKYNAACIFLNDDRSKLYERIDKRVDKMVENGLFEEVKSILDKGIPRNCTALQAIGYKEAVSYYDNVSDLNRTIELIKQNTRHYAKRQITWFKREKDFEEINISDLNYDRDKITDAAMEIINRKCEGM